MTEEFMITNTSIKELLDKFDDENSDYSINQFIEDIREIVK
jgi:hypothetical protein